MDIRDDRMQTVGVPLGSLSPGQAFLLVDGRQGTRVMMVARAEEESRAGRIPVILLYSGLIRWLSPDEGVWPVTATVVLTD